MSCLAPPAPPPPHAPTPPGVSQEAIRLNEESERNWGVQSPDTRLKARVAETINEILQLQDLEDDWDLEGAQQIDQRAILLAALFVQTIGKAVRQEGVSWQSPRVGPVSDGSVVLTWTAGERQALTIFRPSRLASVVCVTREGDGRPARSIVTIQDATRLVLQTLSVR